MSSFNFNTALNVWNNLENPRGKHGTGEYFSSNQCRDRVHHNTGWIKHLISMLSISSVCASIT